MINSARRDSTPTRKCSPTWIASAGTLPRVEVLISPPQAMWSCTRGSKSSLRILCLPFCAQKALRQIRRRPFLWIFTNWKLLQDFRADSLDWTTSWRPLTASASQWTTWLRLKKALSLLRCSRRICELHLMRWSFWGERSDSSSTLFVTRRRCEKTTTLWGSCSRCVLSCQ